ncbi:MAG: non-canonical purine NTP diphosphatase [Hyphomicrobiales bacterium]
MKKLVFATNNVNKLNEIKAIIGDKFEILSLKDINCFDEIEETENTLEGNALLKARYINEKFGLDVFSDDTGLLVDALNGAPGVYSARYAGEQCSSKDNIVKLLKELNGITDRKACFQTVIALILNGKEYLFTGQVDGEIIQAEKGHDGFGYDPIFQPKGYDITFAEMKSEEKNKISHRGKATEKLISFLSKI